MNRVRFVALLLFASPLVWGCSVKPWIHVFNNTGERIVIRLGEKEYVAPPSEEISFLYEDEALAIDIGGCSVLYRITFLPRTYVRTGWFRAHITFQVDPDHGVLVLAPLDKPPVSAASYEQPKGYPLMPTPSEACRRSSSMGKD